MPENENFTIEIEGEVMEDLFPDLMSLEVELDDSLASLFKIKLSISQEADGLWRYLDDEPFRIWKQVSISGGVESEEPLISGYITHVKPNFETDPTECYLDIWGMDGSVLMDREEKLKDWPNKKDSDIASEVFRLYGFIPEIEESKVIHDEAISTIIQRETDIQFLKRLALRNGFECYVDGTTGYFRSAQIDESPQPILAVHFGDETNVTRFSLDVNALTPVNVAMLQVDRINKEILECLTESSLQTALGKTNSNGYLGQGMRPGQAYIGMNSATGSPEMSALCQGLFHEGHWFVTGEGEIIANQYAHVLKPRETVTIKGLGEMHSGIYYVTHVTHSFTPNGYTQSFKVKRNALEPSGSEDFSGTSGLLGGLL